jgi:hypothetical protein
MPIQNSFESLGEPSSKKNPSSGLCWNLFPSPPALVRIAEESDEEESSKEDTQEEEQQVNEESLLKSQPNQDVEEGELPPINPESWSEIKQRSQRRNNIKRKGTR